MQSRLNPYLGFRDNTREAMEFYKTVFGGKIELHTFKELKAPVESGEEDLIMHSMIEADNGIVFMAADTPGHMEYKPGTNVSMSLDGDNEEELSGYFDKLAAGGKVTMPLEKAPWGGKFGMLIDKFGIQWLVSISEKKE